MANSKLLKEAIADAKAVRETALANAKIALEEAFTPRLQSILSKKLREEEGKDSELDEELDSSDIGNGTEDKPKDPQGFDADTDLSVGVEKSSDAVGAELDDYEKVADLNEDEETPKQENLSVAKLRERLQRRLAELEDTTEGEDQTNEDESNPKSEYGMGEDEPTTTESDDLSLEIEDEEDYDVTGNEEEDTETEMDLEAIIRELEAAADEPKNESLADGEEAGTDKGEDPKVVITTERARILRRLSTLNEEEMGDMKKEEEQNEEEENPVAAKRRKIAERKRLAERSRLLRRLAEVEDDAKAQNEDESDPTEGYDGMGEDEPTVKAERKQLLRRLAELESDDKMEGEDPTPMEYGMGEDEPTAQTERRKLRERKQLLRRLAELESDDKMEGEDPTGATLEPTTEEDDVIDLNEILREMEADLKKSESEDITAEEDEPVKQPAAESKKIKEMKRNLKEAYSTIVSLRNTINEVNLLNAKLLFANKLFRAHNLTNEQKVKVIETLDRTKSVREVKLVYSTLAENLRVGFSNKGAKKSITEGFASKVVKSTKPTKRVISEGSDFSARFKKLAGIIK